MNDELQKNMQILMGHGGKTKSLELSADEKKKLSDAYCELFFGLAGANWARGDNTLGAAWYTALQQISGMMGAKNKNNPAAMHLNQIFAAHRAKWSQTIMTHPDKDTKMKMADATKQKWSGARAKDIGNAMAVINTLIQKYQALMSAPQRITPAQVTPPTAATFFAATQRINER